MAIRGASGFDRIVTPFLRKSEMRNTKSEGNPKNQFQMTETKLSGFCHFFFGF
jgi:hypothetical protein